MIIAPKKRKAALGTKTEAASQITSKINSTSNSAAAQRSRLLDYLLRKANITTLEARKNLDVLHPAMRILELRAEGHRIDTVWTHQATDCGKVHRVARYVLLQSQPSLFDVGV